MFDINEFKKKVKLWIKENEYATEFDLIQYCEELIPQNILLSNSWLIDQTIDWFRFLNSKEKLRLLEENTLDLCDDEE